MRHQDKATTDKGKREDGDVWRVGNVSTPQEATWHCGEYEQHGVCLSMYKVPLLWLIKWDISSLNSQISFQGGL